jgi:two-component sensor histidine kinase
MSMNVIEYGLALPAAEVFAQRTLEAEANHRIGNNLALIAAIMRMQGNHLARRAVPVPVDEVRRLLKETAARIESIGRLHRLLCDAGNEAMIDVGGYVREIADGIMASVAAPGTVNMSFDLAAACTLRADSVLPIGLIVGEVISNSIKYAHPTGLPTAIAMDCRKVRNAIVVTIRDDGVGLPRVSIQHQRRPWVRLIRSLATQIGATAKI